MVATLVDMVDDTVDSTLDSGQWLTLAEAARALGVSEKTVRRRVKAGYVAGRQVSTLHGPAWQVCLPGQVDSMGTADNPGTHPSTQVSTPAQPADVAALVVLVARLTTENTELSGENRELARTVAAWQSQAVVLAGRLADAQDRLALAAPSQSPVEAPTATPSVETPTEPRRPWWRTVDGWITPAVALVVLAIVATVLMFSVLR
jgi:hypothetical protein